MAKEGQAKLTVEERRKILFKRLDLSGLKSWTEENKERAPDLLAEYHDIFALVEGEMGCTEAAKHKIEVMDLKPFKERPRNIPSGLLEEVKVHLDHMLDVGAIKPSKSVWSNAVVLDFKKDGDLGFESIFEGLMLKLKRIPFHSLKYMMSSMLLVEANAIRLWTSCPGFGRSPWRSPLNSTQLSP